MNNPVFVSIKGSTQGLITEGAFTPESVGNTYQEGHENETIVKSFSHNSVDTKYFNEFKASGQS